MLHNYAEKQIEGASAYLENFNTFVNGVLVEGTSTSRWSGNWNFSNNIFGFQGMDDFETYDTGTFTTGSQQSGLAFDGDWVGAKNTYKLLGYDNLATYSAGSDLSNLNYDSDNAFSGNWSSSESGVLIREKTVGGNSEKMFVLSNGGDISRGLSIGSSWNKIRVGIRVRVNATGNIAGTPRFAVGLCNGTTNTYPSSNCNNFIGLISSDTTWNHSDANGAYYNLDFRTVLKVGETTTIGDLSSNVTDISSSGSDSFVPFYIDFTRPAANTVGLKIGTVLDETTASSNVSLADFLAIMEVPNPDTAYLLFDYYGIGDFGDSYAERQISVDEAANGVFDSLNIYWSGTQEIEISTIAVQTFEA